MVKVSEKERRNTHEAVMRSGSREKERVPGRRYGPSSKNEANQRPSVCKRQLFVTLRGKFLTLRVLKNEKPPSAFVRNTQTHTTRIQCVFVVLEETNVIDNINHIELK